jgi:hypothetical protein
VFIYFDIIYSVHFVWIILFIYDTNKCSLTMYKYSFTSFLHVSASFRPSSRHSTPRFKTDYSIINLKSKSYYVTVPLQLRSHFARYTLHIIQGQDRLRDRI